jgi:glycosyltransferase involved in cell wall biosynthesis
MSKKIGVFVGEKGNWTFFDHIFDDLKTHYEPEVFRVKTYNTPLLHGRLNRWAFQEGIRSILRKVDVAFFEWASELLVPASHMPKYCPIVTRLHSYELFAWAPDVNWDNVDKIILVSKAMQTNFCEMFPKHAHKTYVIYNAKPLDTFKPIPRDFCFDLGMLGTINPRKRPYEIILMLKALRDQGHDAQLHIAGGRHHAPDMDEYYVATHRLVDKLALQGHVTFYDHISNTAEWLQQRNIFISNSYWEGHQVALVEAMATGCYCLSHFWNGVEEVLPPENIYTTEAELMEKIIHYSHLPAAEQQRHQAQMRDIACQMFDAEQQKVAIRRVIEESLSRS